jgi:hypothetical protein
VRRVVDNPKLLSDHFSHPLARPHIPPKTVRFGSSCQKLGQFGALLLAEEGVEGLCLKPSTPSSLARFIHWLTAPSVTPRASAISVCFQPRSFSSKARKRLPSRQSLAR